MASPSNKESLRALGPFVVSTAAELCTLPQLAQRITTCNRCARLRAHCRTIAQLKKREFTGEEYWGRPVPGFGDPHGRLLIIGLAPAAHGANRTGQLFTGDSSGSWLYEALHRYGWASQPNALRRGDGMVLTDCYITAAAHCAPPGNKPTRVELEHCRPYLEAELRLLTSTRVVLALGRISWEAWLRASGWWERLSPRERPAFGHDRESRMPDGTLLVTSFHPSRQNTNTGKLTREMWYAVFERIRGAGDAFRPTCPSSNPPAGPAAPCRPPPASPSAPPGSPCPAPPAR